MDLSAYKTISLNGIPMKKILIGGVVAWKKPAKNWVPLSIDTDGSIYNGVGYKDGVRLSSSGGISSSAQSGSTTTGFIPFTLTDIIRLKGVEWLNTYSLSGKHHYINFYDSDMTYLTYMSSTAYSGGTYDHVITITRDDTTGVETVQLSQTYGDTNQFLNYARKASYIRITAYGSGADFILTINEEI